MKKIFAEGVPFTRNMPITGFLEDYRKAQYLRCHMPGHHGKLLPYGLGDVSAWDITEIHGADSLFEASGILRESEQQAAALWGSGDACFSAGGSTLCIQAMLAEMRAQGRTVIAARTVHRAFLNACVLLGLPVEWVFPVSGGLIAGDYALPDVEAALRKHAGTPCCVYVTSPDYTGKCWDMAGLAALCRRYDAPLLVDNAHGAHLAFLKENQHPMALGADYCCDSLHKMLPSLTGAAILHSRKPAAPAMKHNMQLFGSTSPSYVILQSMEAAVHWIAHGGGRDAIQRAAARAETLRERLNAFQSIGDDPLHCSMAADGIRLADRLRQQGIECEYADRTCLVLLLSGMMEEDEFCRLEEAFRRCEAYPAADLPPLPAPPEQAVPLREAALAPQKTVPLREAVGGICGAVQVPCPPAVPLLVSGERITAEWAELMAFYGLETVSVMR